MTTQTNHSSSLRQRLALGVVALVAASVVSLGASSAAFGQADPAPAPPVAPPVTPTPAPTDPVGGTLEVSLDVDDDQVEEGEGIEVEVTVRNAGPGAVTGAILELNVDEEFDIDSVTDGGPKTQTDNGDETRTYTLGTLQPGQELSFTVHGEFEDINRSDDGDEFDIDAEVRFGNQSSEDTEEIEVERERQGDRRRGDRNN